MLLKFEWMPAFQHTMLKLFADRGAALVQSTQSSTPNWKYYIDDTKFNRSLAKKQLLVPSVLDQLPALVTAHHEYMTSVSDLITEWGLGEPCSHELFGKLSGESNEVLAYAQETIAVSLAVKVLENVPPSDRPAAAASTLSVLPESFPASVKKALVHAKKVEAAVG